MSVESNDRLIATLTGELTPVRRLRPPTLRALGWLAALCAIAAVMALGLGGRGMMHRLVATPDMAVAAIGSVLTAILAAVAAFQLCLPDRRAAWVFLPLPAFMLWLAASGAGCLRPWLAADTHMPSMHESGDCLIFILGVSVPLSAALILMLRRGYSLRPNLTALMAGLACASAAATLLNFVHPYDATVTDLVVHLFAIAVVVGVNSLLGGRLFARPAGTAA